MTTAHANGDRNDARHRFDRLARGLRISDQLSGSNDMEPFPRYANVYHLSQDDMNLGGAHPYNNRNDASTRRFSRPSRRPRISEDQLTGLDEPFARYAKVYHLSQDDMNLGGAHSYGDGNEATRPFSRPGPRIYDDQLPGFEISGNRRFEVDPSGSGSGSSAVWKDLLTDLFEGPLEGPLLEGPLLEGLLESILFLFHPHALHHFSPLFND
jgi:hypothetical protein